MAQQDEQKNRWGTVFMGPTSDRESTIDKVANREQCELWNSKTENEYLARVRAKATLQGQRILEKAEQESAAIRKKTLDWAHGLRERLEQLHQETATALQHAQTAQADAEHKQAIAHEEGYQRGVEQAMLELDEHRAQLDALSASVLATMQAQFGQLYASWREQLAALLRDAVETSVGWVLTDEKAAVLESLLTNSVHAIGIEQRLIVTVHPDDIPAFQEVLEGASKRFAEVKSWEVQGDPNLEQGSLILESRVGRAENTAPQRKQIVDQVLRHLTLPETDTLAQEAVNAAAHETGLDSLVQDVLQRQQAEAEMYEKEQQALRELEQQEAKAALAAESNMTQNEQEETAQGIIQDASEENEKEAHFFASEHAEDSHLEHSLEETASSMLSLPDASLEEEAPMLQEEPLSDSQESQQIEQLLIESEEQESFSADESAFTEQGDSSAPILPEEQDVLSDTVKDTHEL